VTGRNTHQRAAIRIGVLDIGSNSAHLRIMDARPGAAPVSVFRYKEPTLLAEAIAGDGSLAAVGMRRLVRAVARAAEVAHKQSVDELMVLATATLRDATNAEEILRGIHAAIGITPTVMSGEDEARLTFLAVHRLLGWSASPLMTIDIGGGSTEIAYGHDEHPTWAYSVSIGAGQLTRALLPRHPASTAEVKAARHHVRDHLARLTAEAEVDGAAVRVVGTSKTFKQLARLAGAPPWRRGPYVPRALTVRDVRSQIPRLASRSPRQRAKLTGVEPTRARQILAGAIIAEAAMTAFDVRSMEVVGWAVREGIMLRRLAMIPDPMETRHFWILADAIATPGRRRSWAGGRAGGVGRLDPASAG
jgi:exopolyphosphatase/guanosine-5'-triphosphate,3'-diphosphate pyrophosphatase